MAIDKTLSHYFVICLHGRGRLCDWHNGPFTRELQVKLYEASECKCVVGCRGSVDTSSHPVNLAHSGSTQPRYPSQVM